MPDGLAQHVEDGRHPRRIGLLQGPGRLLVDIAVGGAHHLPLGFQRPVELLFVILGPRLGQQPVRGAEQRVVGVSQRARLRHLGFAVLVDLGQHALRQVAEVVGEVGVHAPDHRLVAEVAVLSERQLAQQEVAHRVEPVAVDQILRRDKVVEDFDIFCPSLVHQPCANTRFGGVMPAARRKAGQ